MGLELQDPKYMTIFSSKDIVWYEIHCQILLERVPHFIKGEEMNPDAPCDFYCNRNKIPGKRDSATLRYEV